MSYALSVFLVPQAVLDRIPAPEGDPLPSEALDALEEDLADHDEQMDAPDLENNDVDISHADALREIFSGQYTEGVNGSRHGWAFESLCSYVGKRLSNEGFSPCKTAWYEELDGILEAAGVPLKFRDLIFDSPVQIPEADDWPCVGHWGADAVAAIEPLSQLLGRLEDREAKLALRTALGWIQALSASPDRIIVGFHG